MCSKQDTPHHPGSHPPSGDSCWYQSYIQSVWKSLLPKKKLKTTKQRSPLPPARKRHSVPQSSGPEWEIHRIVTLGCVFTVLRGWFVHTFLLLLSRCKMKCLAFQVLHHVNCLISCVVCCITGSFPSFVRHLKTQGSDRRNPPSPDRRRRAGC